jgi:hypothetical protein
MDVLGYGLAGRTMAHIVWGKGHVRKHASNKTHARNNSYRVLSLFSKTTFIRLHTLMKRSQAALLLCLLGLINIGVVLHAPDPASGQPPMANGIQPLIQLERQTLHQLIPMNTRPLLLPQEQEHFLQELDGLPPDWHTLQHPDQAEQSERLFRLNRERDDARLAHKNLLQQPIAFLWSGILRQYLHEHQGFSVALGPELTSTSWGIVRFKPIGLPDYLVAVPSLASAKNLLARQQHGEQIEIGVLFIGTLITDESLIYGFSHDGNKEGMILPVVQIQGVKYFIKTP